MRKLLIWTGVIILAVVFGLSATVAVGAIALRSGSFSTFTNSNQPSTSGLGTPTPQASTPIAPGNGSQPLQGIGSGWDGYGMGPGMMNGRGGYGMGPGMMGGSNQGSLNPSGQRLTLDQALEFANQYVASYGSNLEVSEVMEFTQNFYAVVREANTGRGAFELLIDPYIGAVYPEMGPNMMWNFKYSPMAGMMGGSQGGDNTLSLDQAAQDGQKYLDGNIPGATIEANGISFYGHYTFDYTVNDQIAGMLSVNGLTGVVWLHTWHGQFIAEKEVTK